MKSNRRVFLKANRRPERGVWAQKHQSGHITRSIDDEDCISGLARFVDRLPIPPVAQPTGRFKWATYYEIPMTEISQQLHRDLPPTRVWAYAGVYPGPTFETRRDERVAVNWINNLPNQHLFQVDPTIHGAESTVPAVRAVVHLHGANVPPESDGYPEDWITPGQNAIYLYPDKQRPQTLWYHDHALGINGVFGVKKGKWVPYALVGLGGANVQVSPGISSFSDFAFAWQFGGGTRFFIGKNVALRAEVSQLREKTFDAWNGHWNVTGGISWTFGER